MRPNFQVLERLEIDPGKGSIKRMEMQMEAIAIEGDRSAGPVSERPVDLVHLARYTLGNRALEREVLELFLTHSVLYLNRLKQAMSEKDWHNAAHTIKGSARGIGAWQVATSADLAEKLQGDSLDRERGAAVVALEHDIEAANSYIASLLASA
jgi:HPt (histidine-containing phosphotransfer) domain-containing protein